MVHVYKTWDFESHIFYQILYEYLNKTMQLLTLQKTIFNG